MHRWQEECLLLEEEMRRVRDFFQYEARRWKGLAKGSHNQGDEGRHAYALRQADVRHQLYTRCVETWRDAIAYMDLGDDKELRKLVEYQPPE